MRGEDAIYYVDPITVGGSPPHARGRPGRQLPQEREPWITPACAGKTYKLLPFSVAAMDHPRMRGEDRQAGAQRCNELGSPPHARGRLEKSVLELKSKKDHPRMRGEDPTPMLFITRNTRITPACAGKTIRRRQVATTTKDHPRMRGEDRLLTQKVC